MTAIEWQNCTDLHAMLDWVHQRVMLSDRKARLFAVACCRASWGLFDAKALRRAVEASDQYADGLISSEELDKARSAAEELAERAFRKHVRMMPWTVPIRKKFARQVAAMVASADVNDVLEGIGTSLVSAKSRDLYYHNRDKEQHYRCALLRDLFGPLAHRAVQIDRSVSTWKDSTIRKLAQAIYEDQAFDPVRLAILADALEEAGCDDTSIIEHLRGPGPHMRGCWVVDLILGKK